MEHAPGKPAQSQAIQGVQEIAAQPVEHSSGALLPWGHPRSFAPIPDHAGPLRTHAGTLEARTDAAAAAAWLAERATHSEHTAQVYRLAVERLMLWASETLGRSLSELTREDFLRFRAFLLDPQPRERWVMPRSLPRTDERWRPFRRPLSERSAAHTLSVVRSMYRYLTEAGYFHANPVPSPRQPRARYSEEAHRSLSPRAMECVFEAIPDTADTTAPWYPLWVARSQWLLIFLRHLGPRITEVCRGTFGAIRPQTRGRTTRWWWYLRGKGGDEDRLPVDEMTLEAMIDFREQLALPRYPHPDEAVPLLPNIRTTLDEQGRPVDPYALRPVSRAAAYKLLTALFRAAGDRLALEPGYEHDAEALRRASPHWLRHTALREIADTTGDVRLVQRMGRHARLDTSALYMQSADDEVWDRLARRAPLNKERGDS